MAALTIPVITAKIQEKILISQAKKAYSLITNTVNKWCADNGSIGDYSAFWLSIEDTNINDNYYKLLKELTKEMNVIEICSSNDIQKNKCGGDYTTNTDFTTSTNRAASLCIARAVLNNGMIISLSNQTVTSKSCYNTNTTNGITSSSDICGFIVFDVNGAKGPNKTGYDYFEIAYQPQKFSSRWFTRGNLEYAIINDKLHPDN